MPSVRFLIIAGNARSLLANRRALSFALVEAGAQVEAIVPIEDFLPEVEELPVRVHRFMLGRVGTNPFRDVSTIVRLRGLIRQVRPTHVFGYGAKPVAYGAIAGWLAGVEHRFSMVTGLGHAFTTRTWKTAMIRSIMVVLYRMGFGLSSVVFIQNPDDEADLRRHRALGRRTQVCRINGSGIDLHEFPPRPLPDYGTEPTFLFIGRLLTEKGLAEFCEAAAQLAEAGKKARFVVVGPHDPSLPHSVKADDLERWRNAGMVEFVGGQKDVRPWLEACTVLVLPSYREGTPRSVLEAMATGRPVITSDAPGCRETVRDGWNGFLVPPRTVEPLAAAMQRFIDEPELVPRMAQNSLALVREKYDVRKVNAVILEAMGIRKREDADAA